MTYYFYINSGINSLSSADQWQGYYPSISSLYPTTDDFMSSSLYTISWPQNDFLKLNETIPTFTPTIVSQEGQNFSQKKIISSEKSKKRTQKTLEKQILSAKKNSQSNIINQFYSFFGSREKSEKIVERCCSLMNKNPEDYEKILSHFYMSIRLINAKRGRKYVNVAMFLKFFNPEQLSSYLPEMVDKLEGSEVLNMEQLCQIFRRCSKHFLKNISTSAILTSKRISIVSKQQHLKKRRKFLRTILEL